jgi:hypothetical protein
MIIKLFGCPQPGMERMLLNFVGPLSLACALKFYIFLSWGQEHGVCAEK